MRCVVSDLEALFANIVANPDDDTVRLAYADALDEAGGEDNASHAAFIRVQCEAGRIPHESVRRRRRLVGDWVGKPCSHACVRCRLDSRADAILRTSPRWARVPCPEGRGERVVGGLLCGLCDGSHDLLRGLDGGTRQLRKHTFRRGFLDAVEARWADLFDVREEMMPSRTGSGIAVSMPSLHVSVVVSRWAREVVRLAPTLRAVAVRGYYSLLRTVPVTVVPDIDVTRPGSAAYPFMLPGLAGRRKKEWVWTCGFWRRRDEPSSAAMARPDVPAEVFDRMNGGRLVEVTAASPTASPVRGLVFDSMQDADFAMATAVCDLLRAGFPSLRALEGSF